MKETTNRKYPYPEPVGDGADVAYWMQRALEAVDADVQGLIKAEAPALLPADGSYSTTGSLDVLTLGARKQVTYNIVLTRLTGPKTYPLTHVFSSLGFVIPPAGRGTGDGQFIAVVISGAGGANNILQGFINPNTGEVSFRHTAAITVAAGQSLYFTGVYYVAA